MASFRLRLRFWLLATDATFAIDRVARRARGFTSKLYLWTVGKASDSTDWGPPEPLVSGAFDEEEPRVG